MYHSVGVDFTANGLATRREMNGESSPVLNADVKAAYNAGIHHIGRKFPAVKAGNFLFTSESVGAGHPDKLCDQISDAVLDAHITLDKNAKVACETVATTEIETNEQTGEEKNTDHVILCGEVSSKHAVDRETIKELVRSVIRDVGFDSPEKGFDAEKCKISVLLKRQAPEIAAGVHAGRGLSELGAGDQGLMFGYATDETEECMPMTIYLAHQLTARYEQFMKNKRFPWARPDCKSQVTIEYRKDGGAVVPEKIHTVVFSCQHDMTHSDSESLDELRRIVRDELIIPSMPKHLLSSETIYLVNPCGTFHQGGPASDAGLTGRKIIVDSYGGWGGHGGGAFSGKDCTKVDRSAAYAVRYVAKSLVKAGLCRRVLVQVSYAIGVVEPVGVNVDSYGTGAVVHGRQLTDTDLYQVIKDNFDLRPGAIIEELSLRQPIYRQTASFGHFGRKMFAWEGVKELNLNCLKN